MNSNLSLIVADKYETVRANTELAGGGGDGAASNASDPLESGTKWFEFCGGETGKLPALAKVRLQSLHVFALILAAHLQLLGRWRCSRAFGPPLGLASVCGLRALGLQLFS